MNRFIRDGLGIVFCVYLVPLFVINFMHLAVIMAFLLALHTYFSRKGYLWGEDAQKERHKLDAERAAAEVIELQPLRERKRALRTYAPSLGGLILLSPDFNGKEHEILGVAREAPTKIILAAHRFWIAEYHPDKLGPLDQDKSREACARCQQLNDAKEKMLVRRRSRAA